MWHQLADRSCPGLDPAVSRGFSWTKKWVVTSSFFFAVTGKSVNDIKSLQLDIADLHILNETLGSIPRSIKSLTRLIWLDLSQNHLTSTFFIFSTWYNPFRLNAHLAHTLFSFVPSSCILDNIPESIGSLIHLQGLHLNNNILAGGQSLSLTVVHPCGPHIMMFFHSGWYDWLDFILYFVRQNIDVTSFAIFYYVCSIPMDYDNLFAQALMPYSTFYSRIEILKLVRLLNTLRCDYCFCAQGPYRLRSTHSEIWKKWIWPITDSQVSGLVFLGPSVRRPCFFIFVFFKCLIFISLFLFKSSWCVCACVYVSTYLFNFVCAYVRVA